MVLRGSFLLLQTSKLPLGWHQFPSTFRGNPIVSCTKLSQPTLEGTGPYLFPLGALQTSNAICPLCRQEKRMITNTQGPWGGEVKEAAPTRVCVPALDELPSIISI